MAKKSQGEDSKPKKPFYKRVWFIVIAAIFIIGAISSGMEGENSTTGSSSVTNDSESSNNTDPAETSQNDANESQPEENTEALPEEPALEITAKKLVEDLEANALNAKNTYNEKLIKVTGTLGSIDASGKYFKLDPDDGFYITSIQIFINDDLIPTVSSFTKGQSVTVTGKIVDVGELLGYQVEAISIP